MAYAYYQTAPGWGTAQYQFGRPPPPGFQPQYNWGGLDYYRAYSGNADPSLYTSLWSRIREYAATGGVGLHEARVWQRRIYSGQTPLSQVLPADLGAAAAYEAYRSWRYNTYLQDPLEGMPERQREALIGLGVAEATRLWQFTGRAYDNYGLRAAAEAAAYTADRISRRVLGASGGIGSGIAFPGRSDAVDDDPYDDGDGWPATGRRIRRYSSFGPTDVPYRGPSPYPGASPYSYGGSAGAAAPIPIPTAASATYGAPADPFSGVAQSGSYGAGGYVGSAGSYGGPPSPYGAGVPAPVNIGQPAYATQPSLVGYTPSATYTTPAYGATPGYSGYVTGGTSGYGGSYGNYGYPDTSNRQVYQAPAGTTIVIHSPRRRSSTSSGLYRSRSMDGRSVPVVYRV